MEALMNRSRYSRSAGTMQISLVRIGDVKAVGNLELGGVDHRKGHVHHHHRDDRYWKAEISESSTDLGKNTFSIFKI
jgi:hypothetical protein